ncbi:MAG: TcpQ domain-containing protein [Gammaproteobacteria bacterium]|nr:TcpQ domain-containing protein [Gammaproteobacteria bacterium]
MHCILKRFILAILLCLPTLTFATWQIANPNPAQKQIDPRLGKTDYALYYYDNAAVRIYPKKGLLKENIIRIANEQGWKVIWRADQDYKVTRNTVIAGPTFITTMDRLLNHYPLMATYKKSQKIMTVMEKRKFKYYKGK